MVGNGKEASGKIAMMVVEEDVIWWKAKTLKRVVVGISKTALGDGTDSVLEALEQKPFYSAEGNCHHRHHLLLLPQNFHHHQHI